MKRSSSSISSKKIIVVTHRSLLPVIPGADLKDYLVKKKCEEIIFIQHPLLLLTESRSLSSEIDRYKEGAHISNHRAYNWKLPEPLLMLKDLLYTLWWIFSQYDRFDLYFGLNNLNTLAGLILKKFGRVKKVVYYTIDLYPNRFENGLINRIYHVVDAYCVAKSDEVWNVSPAISAYRNRSNRHRTDIKQYTVPIGIWLDRIKRVGSNKTKRNKLVYVGHLQNFFGVDLAIRSLPMLINNFHTIHLDIVGGGEEFSHLRILAKKLKVESYVTFHGWMKKEESEKIIRDAALGLAPFNTTILDEKVRNADPAKIKDYLAHGLPVILTNATTNAALLEEAGCARVIEFTTLSFCNAVTALLSDEKVLKRSKINALSFVKQYDWNIIFEKNLSRILRRTEND